MDDPREVNRRHWDELAALYLSTDTYDVEGFLDGGSTITWLEQEGVGDVDGLDLLTLRCHFRLDTLSWLREGVDTVVGVDVLPVATERTRDLAERSGLADWATFVESARRDLHDRFARQFDVVVTSFGVINWLPTPRGGRRSRRGTSGQAAGCSCGPPRGPLVLQGGEEDVACLFDPGCRQGWLPFG